MNERIPKPGHKFPDTVDTCTVEYACAYNQAIDKSEKYHKQEIERLQRERRSAVLSEEEMNDIGINYFQDSINPEHLSEFIKLIHKELMKRMAESL